MYYITSLKNAKYIHTFKIFFYEMMKKNSYILEAQNFLKNNPDIKSFDIVMHDCNGIGRGKIIRRNELIKIYKFGRNFLFL